MAEALKTFKENEDILASETNANNQFLLGKISDNALQVQNYVEGEISAIKSSLSSTQNTLQNNINNLSTTMNNTIGANGLYTTTYINGTSWYREFFSDSGKKTRVWLEQGGESAIDTNLEVTTSLLKNFSNTNYHINGIYYAGSENAVRARWITNKTTSSFKTCGSGRSNAKFSWYACGK